jgi:hypothetical protein
MQGMDFFVRIPGQDMGAEDFEDLKLYCQSVCDHLSRIVVDRDSYIQKLDDVNETKKSLEIRVVRTADDGDCLLMVGGRLSLSRPSSRRRPRRRAAPEWTQGLSASV